MRVVLVLVLVLAIAALLPPAGHAQPDPDARARASLERIQALRIERPRDGALTYYQAMVQAQLGERDAALAALRMLLGRRLGIVPAEGSGFDGLWRDADFQSLRQRLAAEEPKTPAAPVRLRLHDAQLIPEGIAWDGAGRRFFIGSIAQHKIVALDRAGREHDFSRSADRLDAVLGMAVDARHRQLLAVSTN